MTSSIFSHRIVLNELSFTAASGAVSVLDDEVAFATGIKSISFTCKKPARDESAVQLRLFCCIICCDSQWQLLKSANWYDPCHPEIRAG